MAYQWQRQHQKYRKRSNKQAKWRNRRENVAIIIISAAAISAKYHEIMANGINNGGMK
jgi:hypothetical protein